MSSASIVKGVLVVIVFTLVAALFVLLFKPVAVLPVPYQAPAAYVYTQSVSGSPVAQEEDRAEVVSRGTPIRLTIPRIGLDAPIESLGLTPGGAVDVPKVPDSTAWFNRGPHPGEVGSAVIVGHYGWKDDIPAVFDNVHTLVAGDEVTVEDDRGVVAIFVVREIRTYGKDEYVPEAFASRDRKAHLNLITCTGEWSVTEKTRARRLIVFTDKVE